MNNFRKKMFRGSKIEDMIFHLEQLATLSKERAERYANHTEWHHISADLHEGIYQGYKDSLELIKAEFSYPDKP